MKFSSRFNFEVLTPVLVRHSDCEKQFSPSKQVYSMDIRPMSAVQLIPSSLERVFIELRTRHAPVPQERSIMPHLPTTEAFSISPALVIGMVSSLFSA